MQIKCSRCGKIVKVSDNYEFKECYICHSRTSERNRAKGKVPIEKIENKAINEFLQFEKAWQKAKRMFPTLQKEKFLADFMRHNYDKIERIKQRITRYNDINAPIINFDCYVFRTLWSRRNSYLNRQDFVSSLKQSEEDLFYIHHSRCLSCNRYAHTHKFEVEPEPQHYREATEQEFNQSINDFFQAFKSNSDQQPK